MLGCRKAGRGAHRQGEALKVPVHCHSVCMVQLQGKAQGWGLSVSRPTQVCKHARMYLEAQVWLDHKLEVRHSLQSVCQLVELVYAEGHTKVGHRHLHARCRMACRNIWPMSRLLKGYQLGLGRRVLNQNKCKGLQRDCSQHGNSFLCELTASPSTAFKLLAAL